LLGAKSNTLAAGNNAPPCRSASYRRRMTKTAATIAFVLIGGFIFLRLQRNLRPPA
jgi:hypothetical protein